MNRIKNPFSLQIKKKGCECTRLWIVSFEARLRQLPSPLGEDEALHLVHLQIPNHWEYGVLPIEFGTPRQRVHTLVADLHGLDLDGLPEGPN